MMVFIVHLNKLKINKKYLQTLLISAFTPAYEVIWKNIVTQANAKYLHMGGGRPGPHDVGFIVLF